MHKPVSDRSQQEATALADLLRRLDGKPGFPALSESVAAINEITNSEDQNIDDLAKIIQCDVGLTASILRVANSANYRGASGSGVTTVARAVSVLGFSTLRDIALTVALFEQMKSRADLREIKETFLRAQLAGTIAREAGKLFLPRSSDDVYTSALLHSLGQIVVQLYLPDEASQIQEVVQQQGVTDDVAATGVLGLDFSRIGLGVAEQWRFPISLVRSLRSLPDGVITKPESSEDMLWLLAGFGNEVSGVLASAGGLKDGSELSALRRRFADVMKVSAPQLHALVHQSLDETKVFASALGVRLTQSKFVQQVSDWVEAGAEKSVATGGGVAPSTAVTDAAAAKAQNDRVEQLLSAGIGKLSDALVGDFVLNEIFRIALETLSQAIDFQRVLLCLRDDKSGNMVARKGHGTDVELIVRKFRFPLQDAPNVFQLAIAKGLDMVIMDIADEKIADKIPAWYRNMLSARCFVLMPLTIKGRAVGLIYADKQQANSIVISEQQMSLMKTLRNQALLALKQSMP